MSAKTPAADRNAKVRNALQAPTEENAKVLYETLTLDWGMPEVPVERGRVGVPLSRLKDRILESHQSDEETFAEKQFGTKSPFVAAAAAGPAYQEGSIKQVDDMREKAAVDESVVGAASPVEVDPEIVDVQRSAAPVLSVIQSVAQAGFTAQYNVIDNRNDPIGFVSESEAMDLSGESEGDFSLTTATKDMKIWADQVNISDFAQRAESSLGYMDLTQTTMGQRVVAHALQKAKAIFYGDPSVGAGDKSVEDADAYEGLAKIAVDAGNNTDKSTVSSGFLDDLLDEVTVKIENSGLTWDRARILCSPRFYNAVYDEVTPVVRIDGYDADVEYGPRGLAISTDNGTVQLTSCPNIRNYSGLSGTNFTSDNGDVFLIDEQAVQFRQLAPLSTVPLGRVGLADKVAMFEYGTLIDKSQGEHIEYFEGYDI